MLSLWKHEPHWNLKVLALHAHTLSKLFATLHSRKGETVSSCLGDKFITSPVQGTSEIFTVEERSHIANAHLSLTHTPRRPMGRSVGSGKFAVNLFQEREREPLLLLTNQFHNSFKCSTVIVHEKTFCTQIRGQHQLRCSRDLLVRRSLPANSTSTCVWLVQGCFFFEIDREDFLLKMGLKKPKEFHYW